MITVACVLKTGGWCTKEDVLRLKRNCTRNLNFPHKFVCLSDIEIEGVTTIPLKRNLKNWWCKLELFRSGALKGRILFLDLDTVIVGDIQDEFQALEQDVFWGLNDFYRKGTFATGLMYWNTRKLDLTFIYQPDKVMTYPPGYWEQCFVEKECKKREVPLGYLNDVFSGIQSYKVDLDKGRLLPDTAIVCFHGKPKPSDVVDEHNWIKEAWL